MKQAIKRLVEKTFDIKITRNNSKISRRQKIFFDHLAKCGGSSAHHFLKTGIPPKKILNTNLTPLNATIQKTLCKGSYTYIMGHYATADEIINILPSDYLKITVLRNPVDRIISLYFKNTRACALKHGCEITLRDYVFNERKTYFKHFLFPFVHEFDYYINHFSGMNKETIRKHPDKAIEASVSNILNKFDIIGLTDQLNDFLLSVGKKANLHHPISKERKNKGSEKPIFRDTDLDIIEHIEKMEHNSILFYQEIRKRVLQKTAV